MDLRNCTGRGEMKNDKYHGQPCPRKLRYLNKISAIWEIVQAEEQRRMTNTMENHGKPCPRKLRDNT